MPAKALVVRREYASPCEIREVRVEDRPALIEVFKEAFTATIDFCDATPEYLYEVAVNCVHKTYSEDNRFAAASRIAIDGDRLVGAALFVHGDHGPHLDALFVGPSWQRRGIATAMFFSAMNSLLDVGESEVTSCYDIGNDKSAAWHEAVGFSEIPDEWVDRLRHQADKRSAINRKRLEALETGECITL